MKRKEIIDCARSLLGVKYRHMGRNGRDGRVGLDCGGLITSVGDGLGVKYRDMIGTYSIWPTDKQLERLFDLSLDRVDEIKLGSICLMYHTGFYDSGNEPPQHAFIVTNLDPLYILHATDNPSLRCVVEHIIPPKWDLQISQVYDLPGVED